MDISKKKNLSDYNIENIPDASNFKFALVVSEWNINITRALLEGAIETFKLHKVKEENIITHFVPGSYELAYAAKLLSETNKFDAIICIGCVIQGETPHFTFISDAIANGIMLLNIKRNTPIIFGVLTTNTIEQAAERAGGKHGNKGIEAAVTAIKMASLKERITHNL